MKESRFQKSVIEEIKNRFPGCIVLKNDASYIQGIPDLTIFWGERWGTLECKQNERSSCRPNQEYYVRRMNGMSFSAFIFPENREEVLNEMEQAFKGHSRR